MLEDKIIWQPINLCEGSDDFSIIVDKEFIRKAFELKIEEKGKMNFNQLAKTKLGINRGDIFEFYQNSSLITMIRLQEAQSWLELDTNFNSITEQLKKNTVLSYKTHNSNSISQRIDILNSMSFWVEYLQPNLDY